MEFTKEMIEKAKTAKSAEELAEMAKAEGVELTAEEAAKAFAKLNKTGALADEELDNVVGGCGGKSPRYGNRFDSAAEVTYKYSIGDEVAVDTGVGIVTFKILDRGTGSGVFSRSGYTTYYAKYKIQAVSPEAAMGFFAGTVWINEVDLG